MQQSPLSKLTHMVAAIITIAALAFIILTSIWQWRMPRRQK
jgi:hypothetical protein